MTEEDLMRLAIQEAVRSTEPLKCGCVIAKDGEVLASEFNSQRNDHNATAHGEIKAIAAAGKKVNGKDLFGCVAFCTCEPCTMCLSAMIFAKIETVYFGVPLSDVRINIRAETLVAKSTHQLKLVPGFLEDEIKAALGM